MKKLIISILLLLAGATAAPAADLFNGGQDEHPGAQYASAFHGLGVGVDLGGQFTSLDVAGVFDGISADGFVGGVHGEYLFAAGIFRIGPYVEAGFSDVNTQIATVDLLSQDYYAGGGIKAGVTAYRSSLISVHAGYEQAGWSSDLFSGDIDVASFVIGGGVETMVTPNVSFGVKADYLVPQEIDANGTDVTSALEDSEQLRVKARVTWRN